jgi:hypothetical protein
VITVPARPRADRVRSWLLQGLDDAPMGSPGPRRPAPPQPVTHPWWKVMCLTGLDYFSTLGYQPGIAAVAAGVLSPVATLVLVVLTLGGALPIYRRVAAESPRGQGSLALLERVLPEWAGKVFVLVLLGFAATDFLITMTLSAADATAHAIENPFAPAALHGRQVLITLVLLALLGAVFLKGFTEAIAIAVGLVGLYLVLNLVVVATALARLAAHPELVRNWERALTTHYSSPLVMAGVALLVFPRLALGLSGFETGVAVMPQIRGEPGDTDERPLGRIRGARKLLTTAALIMSVFLLSSSVVTTVLIPADEFRPGGAANGRALAYLAHAQLGDAFGTAYDLSTIAILWFAGASAMAGLLNLVPKYLPRYGMAPEWARAVRPLVLVFTVVAFLVTWIFRADVNAQGGAYATGVLVLITSAAVAVTLSAHRQRQRRASRYFGVVAAVFVYTTVTNIVERPEGVKIASCFIAGILVVSFTSRILRSFELRVDSVEFDLVAARFLDETAGPVRIVANEPDERDAREYAEKERETRERVTIPPTDPLMFLEVTVTDPSEFSTDVCVVGEDRFGYRILRVDSPIVPNAIAAVLLAVRDRKERVPHVYFEWTEGNPLWQLVRFLFLGVGEIAPVTREVLREAEPEPKRRPVVHVA